eukprot:gnl/Dysnectes_brevis/4145_a5461_719.p1 GENE.gnl/Dysnectes_brevis/4145_a5461_719~~gnl/Dysnectes_brevis/4145_a5461_719.p1  ORF type:complete len:521 (+),score=150.68 gnl/Dysnectes_brevis/4145_a5461_719:78-1640(+)
MLLLVFLSLVVTVFSFVRVDPETLSFIDDEDGRELIFHGVNVVYKIAPFLPDIDGAWNPDTSFNEQDVQILQDLGLNLVRLGVMWGGTYPDLHMFNVTYLQEIDRIVTMLADAGIYTIIDLHQDLLSERYCGEGVPTWAVPASRDAVSPFALPILDRLELDEEGYPSRDDCLDHSFGLFYSSDAVGALFECLYTDCDPYAPGDGSRLFTLLSEFERHWAAVAAYFKGKQYVLGYDILNEPWPGDIYAHPLYLLESKTVEAEVLQPFYERVFNAIWEQDKTHLLMYEPDVISFGGTGYPAGGPSSSVPSEYQVYNFHIYCALQDEHADPISRLGCDVEDSYLFDLRVESGRDVCKNAIIMTEFGAVYDDPKADEELIFVTELAAGQALSTAYWSYKAFNDISTQIGDMGSGEGFFYPNGTMQEAKVRILTHPFPRRVGGTLLATEFMQDDGLMYLHLAGPEASGTSLCGSRCETEILVNDLWSGWGNDIRVTPAGSVDWEWRGNVLVLITRTAEPVEIFIN